MKNNIDSLCLLGYCKLTHDLCASRILVMKKMLFAFAVVAFFGLDAHAGIFNKKCQNCSTKRVGLFVKKCESCPSSCTSCASSTATVAKAQAAAPKKIEAPSPVKVAAAKAQAAAPKKIEAPSPVKEKAPVKAAKKVVSPAQN
jgi:hypothetical protein